MRKAGIVIMGKLPPPYMGPAVATQVLLQSSLKERYRLIHFNTGLNTSLETMGQWSPSKTLAIAQQYRRFSKLLQQSKPDLVLLPISQTSAGFAKDAPFIHLAARSGVKVLLHLRGSAFKSWYAQLAPLWQAAVRSTMAKACGVVVLGENLRALFSEFFAPEQIHVVPNGADYQFPMRSDRHLRLCYIANYLPGKGLYEVLLALEQLSREEDLPPFVFDARGSWDKPSYRLRCESLLSLPALAHCSLGPPISGAEKWQLLADSDIFIFTPGHPEGHPWSLVEAAAAGLPIISTDRGAIAQTVISGVNGYLLEQPEPTAIAQALRCLLSNEALREKYGRGSKELYLKYFTAERMCHKLSIAIDHSLKAACVA